MSRDEVKGREHLVRRQGALTAVFKRFSAVWPRAFAVTQWPTLFEPWMDALHGVATDVLEPAARELLRDGEPKYPPKPWEFAKFARTIEKRSIPAAAGGGQEALPRDALHTARPFRYAKPGRPEGFGRLDQDWAIGFALAGGGFLNVSEADAQRMAAKELTWSWMQPAEVPPMAAPPAFFASWRLTSGAQA
jgi:hypothetical protein